MARLVHAIHQPPVLGARDDVGPQFIGARSRKVVVLYVFLQALDGLAPLPWNILAILRHHGRTRHSDRVLHAAVPRLQGALQQHKVPAVRIQIRDMVSEAELRLLSVCAVAVHLHIGLALRRQKWVGVRLVGMDLHNAADLVLALRIPDSVVIPFQALHDVIWLLGKLNGGHVQGRFLLLCAQLIDRGLAKGGHAIIQAEVRHTPLHQLFHLLPAVGRETGAPPVRPQAIRHAGPAEGDVFAILLHLGLASKERRRTKLQVLGVLLLTLEESVGTRIRELAAVFHEARLPLPRVEERRSR
mmetsp:Transcript_102636/g.290071  ORF Transcript_102636/g.290071 Transcript_102636/m.290071 type:complete len:300 (+) Transcript_102636:1927-2826(+)